MARVPLGARAFSRSGGFVPDDVAILEQPVDAGATAAPSASSAPEAPREASPKADLSNFPSFDDVFGPKQDAPSGSSGEQAKAEAKADQPPAATSAPAPEAATAQNGADTTAEGAAEPAEPETETTADGKPKLSRVAKVHEEYKPIIAAKDQELADLRAKLAEATGTLTAEQQREQAIQAQFLDAYGPDDEYERLTLANNKGLPLAADDYDNLERWTKTRELAKPFMAQAEARVQAGLAEARQAVIQSGEQFADYLRSQLDQRTAKYGLDPATVQKAEYGGLIDHAVSVTERRKDAEYAPKIQERDDRISQLDAQLREAQDALKGYQAPELLRGGHPSEVAATPTRVFSSRDVDAPLTDLWDRAFGSGRNAR